MDSTTNVAFTNFLEDTVRETESLGYPPRRFKAMLQADGGFETVKRILASGKPSDGFIELWKLKRLDLSCEAIIVETKWRQYFDADLIARSEKLLRESRYTFKAYAPTEPAAVVTDPANPSTGNDAPSPGVEPTNPAITLPDPAPTPTLGINAFFATVLNAPLANPRWSWGAVNEFGASVFLRLWRMDLTVVDGRRCISVLGTGGADSHGWKERERHIELIKSGHSGYGVLCDKGRPDSGTITGFDQANLAKLGQVFEKNGEVFVEFLDMVSVAFALGFGAVNEVADDLLALSNAPIPETTRTALMAARVGQGNFRQQLMRRWDSACAVSGCRISAMLRASHCKPWRDSDNGERLDPDNGLLLVANLDALFDAGWIAFDDAGAMLVTGSIPAAEQKALGLPAPLTRAPSVRLRRYLAYHRENVFSE